MLTISRACVLGAGRIGSALAKAFISHRIPLNIYNRSSMRLDDFRDRTDVSVFTDAAKAVDGCDWIFICTEGDAVASMALSAGANTKAVIVSCAASSSYSSLEVLTALLGERPVIRLIPNIAATIGASTNVMCYANIQPDTAQEYADGLSGILGETIILPERLLAAGMALSSCGIAYALRYIRAAQTAGIQMGLDAGTAAQLAAGALVGAGELIRTDMGHPEQLADRVCTPGGFTIKGLNALDEKGFSAAVQTALITAAGAKS